MTEEFKSVEEIKEEIKSPKVINKIKWKMGLSSGSTLLNLAASGRPDVYYIPGNFYFMVGDSNSGKAQPLDCNILTPDGWVKMRDLKIGDEVVDPDGGSAFITGIFPQGIKEVFEVTFSDKTSTKCCNDHLWEVFNSVDIKKGKTRTKSLKEIQRDFNKANKRNFIPRCSPVTFKSKGLLPLHPYFLGCLLGNGHMGNKTVTFTSKDKEIVDRIKSVLPEKVEMKLFKNTNNQYRFVCGRRNVPIVREAIKKLGLMDHLSYDKFIPEIYLKASIEDRVALLQGLMDTDGYSSDIHQLDYYTISPRLAKDVAELVRSLGGFCSRRIKETPRYYHKGELRFGSDCYELRLRSPNFCPFSLTRKKERYKMKQKGGNKKIISVESIGFEKCQCITVSSKRNLYVTDDYIVTHNSFFSLNAMAEASINSKYDNYRFIYDNNENGAMMNLEKFFGKKMANRVEPPRYDHNEEPVYSDTIQSFYYNLDDVVDEGKPFIYVLDSMDSLSSEEENKKFTVNKKIYEKNKKKDEDEDDESNEEKSKGSFGDGKAKVNAANLRRFLSPLRKLNSILIIINQTRDNVGMFVKEKKTRSGGHALKFYAQVEMWSSVKEKEFRTVKAVKRHIGNTCLLHIKRSRFTGKEAKVEVPIYYSHGIDDVGSCVQYLLEENHWKKSGTNINAKEFDVTFGQEKLIKHIEENNLEKELKNIVTQIWNEIEEACKVERKNKYQ